MFSSAAPRQHFPHLGRDSRGVDLLGAVHPPAALATPERDPPSRGDGLDLLAADTASAFLDGHGDVRGLALHFFSLFFSLVVPVEAASPGAIPPASAALGLSVFRGLVAQLRPPAGFGTAHVGTPSFGRTTYWRRSQTTTKPPAEEEVGAHARAPASKAAFPAFSPSRLPSSERWSAPQTTPQIAKTAGSAIR